MAKKEKKPGVLPQIIAAVVVALVAGGSSPWWWSKVFPPQTVKRDMTGTWVGGTGIYSVTQEGNRIVWDGIGRYGDKIWRHKATGTLAGDTISATLVEQPDSFYPAVPGGAPTQGTISSDWQTITWTGMNDQERVWHRK
jgi:hypothetical protein